MNTEMQCTLLLNPRSATPGPWRGQRCFRGLLIESTNGFW